MIYTVKYCMNDNIKTDEIGGACGTNGISDNLFGYIFVHSLYLSVCG
jgi:hypothetical protein